MKIVHSLLVTALMLLVLAGRDLQAIEVSQSLNKNEIAFEDSARFEIRIEWAGDQTAYRFERALSPFFDRLKVKGFSSSISSQPTADGEITTKIYSYILAPTSSGPGKIDPITIPYLAMPDSVEGELLTEPMEITIGEPIPKEEEDGSNSPLLLMFAAVIILGAVGIVMIIRRRSALATEPELSPKEIFIDRLDATKAEAGSDLKRFQSGLYSALNDYLKSVYNLEAGEKSAEAIVEAFDAADLSEDQKQKLAHWLVKAREDKFRPVASPPGEVVRLDNEIRTLFKDLK